MVNRINLDKKLDGIKNFFYLHKLAKESLFFKRGKIIDCETAREWDGSYEKIQVQNKVKEKENLRERERDRQTDRLKDRQTERTRERERVRERVLRTK